MYYYHDDDDDDDCCFHVLTALHFPTKLHTSEMSEMTVEYLNGEATFFLSLRKFGSLRRSCLSKMLILPVLQSRPN